MIQDNEVNNNIKVIKEKNGDSDNIADMELLITSGSREEILEYDKQKIVDSLMKETGMARSTANQIAAKVDKEISTQNYTTVSTSYIRELIHLELRRRGFTKKVEEYDNIIFPVYNIENIIKSASVNNQCRDIYPMISSYILRDFSLKKMFSPVVRDAHLSGAIHLHGLGKPTSLYQGVVSLDYIKSHGLEIFGKKFFVKNVKDLSSFLKLSSVFTGCLQKKFVGAVGFVYANVFLAPFIDKDRDSKSDIFNFLSSLHNPEEDKNNQFVEFGINWSIPAELESAPVLGPESKYMAIVEKRDAEGNLTICKIPLFDKIMRGNKWKPRYISMLQENFQEEIVDIRPAVYKDYAKEARYIASVMMEYNSSEQIDCNFLSNIKLILTLDEKDIEDDILLNKISDTLNLDIFILRPGQKNIRQPCGMLFNTNGGGNLFKEGTDLLNIGSLQNITINLAQCVYRAKSLNKKDVFQRVNEVLNIVAEAHSQKMKYMKDIVGLKQSVNDLTKIFNFFDFEKLQCSVSFVALSEMVDLICEQDGVEGVNKEDLRLEVLSYIYLELKKLSEEHNISLILEESVFASVNMRFCKIDLKNYPDISKKVIKGDINTDSFYYTDSDKLAYDRIDGVQAYIEQESIKHSLIKGRANLVVFSQEVSGATVKFLISKIIDTQCEACSVAQTYYFCTECSHIHRGYTDFCSQCNSNDFEIIAHDGYIHSLVSSWNNTKQAEFNNRLLVNLNNIE